MSDTPTPRARPTVAAIRVLEQALAVERRNLEREQAQHRHTLANLDAAIIDRDTARAQWDAFDPETVALGRLVAPLTQYADKVRGDQGGLDAAGVAERDADTAAAVARVLMAVGSRFGASLVVAP